MSEISGIRYQFDTLEEMASNLRYWEVKFRPLGVDSTRTELTQASLGPLVLTHLSTGCRHFHEGASPPGAYTFALLADTAQDVHWCRQRLNGNRMPFFAPAQDFEATAHPRFSVFTLTIDPSRLDTAPEWERFRQRMIRRGSSMRQMFAADDTAIRCLRELVWDMQRLYLGGALSQATERVVADRTDEIIRQLLNVISQAVPAREPVNAAARARAVRKAVELVKDQPGEFVRVDQIYQAAHVSERTLRRAFLEHFGITPKDYIQTSRLGGVRDDLSRSTPTEMTVRDIAVKWGFWHMGQFTRDYKKLFGELPSETLRRQPSDLRPVP